MTTLLLDLPNELLLSIADHLKRDRDINAFARVNRRLYVLLDTYLYQHNIQQRNSSALLWAAKHGRQSIVRRLLREGADVQATRADSQKPTALHLASRKKHLRIVEILIRSGANIDAQTCNGFTPLHMAVMKESEPVARLLLENGADFRKEYPDCDRRCTALHMASLFGATAIVQLLLEKGADISAQDIDLQTPLHYAVKVKGRKWRGNVGTVRYLIENNADMDVRDMWGRRPQDLAEYNPMINLYEAGLLDLKKEKQPEKQQEKQRQKRTERSQKLMLLFLLGFIMVATFRFTSRRKSARARAKNRWHVRA
jgi:ankyrin repeat protein